MISFKDIYQGNNEDSRRTWREIRILLKKRFSTDSTGLMKAVIKRLQLQVTQSGSIDSIFDSYQEEVSYLVNNPRSRFYMYG